MSHKKRAAGLKLAGIGCAAAAAAAGALLYAIAPGKYTEGAEKPFVNRNFAHRGLHSKKPNVPENTMPAFLAAAEKGYGIELDVQLTADDEVVVFHDHDLKRACRRQKKICDLTYAELKEIPLFGSFERVPRFADVLAAVNGRVPLIVELKDGLEARIPPSELGRKISHYDRELRQRIVRYDIKARVKWFSLTQYPPMILSVKDIEEERRICYVGVTRAKKHLYLTSAWSRMRYGRSEDNDPSRFIKEMDTTAYERYRKPSIKNSVSSSSFKPC